MKVIDSLGLDTPKYGRLLQVMGGVIYDHTCEGEDTNFMDVLTEQHLIRGECTFT